MQRLRRKVTAILQTDYGRGYELVVGGLAFLCALAMSVPFAGPMIAAVLFQPKRWRRIVFATAFGSALGATVLLWAFHHGAWEWLMREHPTWVTGTRWATLDAWLERYGIVALFGIMTLPLPESPALAFLARTPQSLGAVFVATFLGKFLKYLIYGYAVVRVRGNPSPPPVT